MNGGPITITHPEMTRYFMSIQEASQLILQCGALGRDGEIFLLRDGTANTNCSNGKRFDSVLWS